MVYVILAAGMGTRLHPFTKTLPKCMLQIGGGETIVQRMVRLIRTADPGARTVVVTGFRGTEIEGSVSGCEFVSNPFYAVTNSIASLWFARDALQDEVTIINGDIVLSERLFRHLVSLRGRDFVLLDSSVKKDGDYNVQTSGDDVVVMSKTLETYFGEYAGVTRLTKGSAALLREEIGRMVDDGSFNEWYENALVQMILNAEFRLKYVDAAEYEWTEVDSVNHLLLARRIQELDRSASP